LAQICFSKSDGAASMRAISGMNVDSVRSALKSGTPSTGCWRSPKARRKRSRLLPRVPSPSSTRARSNCTTSAST
jgi:hypothetical protein